MKKIGIFLALTFILTWSVFLGLWLNGGLQNPLVSYILPGCMLIPAISAVITTFVTKEKLKDLWIKPNFKGHIRYYLIAWLLPAFLIIFGGIIYYLVFPSNYDSNMTFMVSQLKKQYVSLKVSVPSDATIKMMLFSEVGIALFLSPILNFIPCLGEELGWRGYLLPNFCKKYSALTAVLFTGVIWGVWHAPLIAMGYNYGLGYPSAPFGGILAMIFFCVLAGSLFGYLAIKVNSCIPTVIGHGMINGFASVPTMFLAISNPNIFVGPALTGVLGGSGFILAGAVCMYLLHNTNKEIA